MLGNATPDIRPLPGRCGGLERQDIDRSYSKRSLWVRESGRAGGIEDDRPKPREKSDLPVVAMKVVKAIGAKGGAGLKSVEPWQLAFVFAPVPGKPPESPITGKVSGLAATGGE